MQQIRQILPVGAHYSNANALEVIPNGGAVAVQLLEADGVTWYTPAAAENTITEKGVVSIERRNMPTVRILATGGAVFSITGRNS
jgi:hypothetical protein